MKSLIPLLTLLIAGAHAAESWPQFRGPNGAGIAADAARPPVAFGPDKNLRWKTAVPRGVSSPIVSGDRVFVTGVADGAIVTLALDAKDGRELWRKALPAAKLETVHAFRSAGVHYLELLRRGIAQRRPIFASNHRSEPVARLEARRPDRALV
jgi:outer membrane protein assembly factor BamB